MFDRGINNNFHNHDTENFHHPQKFPKALCIYIHTDTHTHTRMCICMHVCVYIYIHTQTLLRP